MAQQRTLQIFAQATLVRVTKITEILERDVTAQDKQKTQMEPLAKANRKSDILNFLLLLYKFLQRFHLKKLL